jgi:hypothetical protein
VSSLLAAVWFLSFLNLPEFPDDSPPRELVTGAYERVRDVADLPPAIVRFFDHFDFCPGLAARGEDFNSTCIVELGRACRRLISAGRAADIWFVHYETGGFVAGEFVGVFRVVAGEIAQTWTFLDRHPTDIEDLLRFIEDGDVCLVTPAREEYGALQVLACR